MAVACESPTSYEFAPDPDRLGEDGTLGPFGVLRQRLEVAVSPTEARGIEVFQPVGPRDAPIEDRSLVVILPGGFVDPTRYRWLAGHIATRGYLVAITEHRLNAALLEPDVPARAREAILDHPRFGPSLLPDAPAVALGHSLGGVAATRWWSESPEIVVGLGLLASVPGPGAALDDEADRSLLAITGDRDGRITPTEIEEALDRFPAPPTLHVIDGMNHFQWTDGVSAADERRDEPATRSTSAVRRDALRHLDPFLDRTLPSSLDDEEEDTDL